MRGNGVPFGGSGGGKLKSVGLTMPAEYSVANSPLTESGTLAVTKANQAANLVYAGPTNGAAAQPDFRALVAADIPSVLSVSKLSNLSSNGFVKTSSGDGTLSVGTIASADIATALTTPGPIGGTTPGAITGTTITANTSLTASLLKPPSDSTTAFVITKADGTTNVLVVNSANSRIGIGKTPTELLDMLGSSTGVLKVRLQNSNTGGGAYASFQLLNDANGIGAFFKNSAANTTYGGASSFNMIQAENAALTLGTNDTVRLTISGAGLFTIAEASNIALGTTTGTKIGTATSQKLAFWNVTPIIQPTTATSGATFVANSGTAVNDASTFDGYTIPQLARIIRNLGLAA